MQSGFVDSLVAVLFFVGATLGHFTLTVRSHNWWYGSPLNRHVTDVIQVLHGLVFLAGPVVFWLWGPDLRPLLAADATPTGRAFGIYAAGCWLVGMFVLPAVTVARLRKRCPALESNHTETIDIAAELGFRPAGTGTYRLLTYLPGNQVFQLDVTGRTLLLPRLPAQWDGLTILHLTDLHLCGTPDRAYFERVLERCRRQEVDLVAITGDLVDTVEHRSWLGPLLSGLRGRVGSFAILGNHDHWGERDEIRAELRRAGLTVLENNWEMLEVRGRPLVVIGHEGPWQQPAPDVSGCPEGVFRLCLSHTPDNMPWARRHGIDLMLSGHVHGGQVRLPLLGSLLVPSRYGRRYDCGVFREGPTVLHVCRGVSGQHPLRYNCRPEVVRLVLRQVPAE